ncbi:Uncharacterised protein [Chlamydia abortus]|nr:Uncharacterised protein [Chlamydia abortus]
MSILSIIERPKAITFFPKEVPNSIIALILVKLEAKAVTIIFFSASNIYFLISFRISLSEGEWLGHIALVESENNTSKPSSPIFFNFEKSVKFPIGV